MPPSVFHPSVSCARLLCAVFFLSASVSPTWAQKSKGPKYDLGTEAKMKGTVAEVKLPPQKNEIVHLLVTAGTETVDVYLCPKAFLDDMGVSFAKGDDVAITGSKVKSDGADLVLAREVLKGTDTLVLRDDKGNPVW
jgi:sporulation protein YlmC with PRC-barrel domain